MLYEVVKRTMFLLPPEKIHTFVFGMIKTLHLVPALGQLASSVFNYEDDILAQDLFGVHFPAPLQQHPMHGDPWDSAMRKWGQ